MSMSCNLDKVVDEVLKLLHGIPGQDARIKEVQNNIEVQAKAIAKLAIQEKNMQVGYTRMTKVREENIAKLNNAVIQKKERDLQKLKENESLNVVTEGVDVTKAVNDKLLNAKGSRYSSYMRAVTAVIDDIVKPLKTEDANMLIEGYLQHQKLVAGQYDIKTHTVTFAAAGAYEGYKRVAEQIVVAKYITEIDDTKVEASATDLVVNGKNVTDEVAQVAKQLEAAVQELVDTDGRHITLHEMIHAATARHMVAAPDSVGVKRIKDLYRLALDYKAQIVEQLDDEVDGEYWATNVHEFVAEALSNPKLMKVLDGITVKKQSKISSLFKELYASIMSLFGFTNEDSLYGYVLDGFMRIMEEQALKTETETHSPAAKFKSKLDKILSSKTKELIVELTKDCR